MTAETSKITPGSPFNANGASTNGASANGTLGNGAITNSNYAKVASLNGASLNGASATGASNVAVDRRLTDGTAATAADLAEVELSAAASGGATRQGPTQQLKAGSANGTGKPLVAHLATPAELEAAAIDGLMGSCDAGQLESCAYERCAPGCELLVLLVIGRPYPPYVAAVAKQQAVFRIVGAVIACEVLTSQATSSTE